jgi:cysteine sulfinate desulfinase/cysteine desulfurase-like protein
MPSAPIYGEARAHCSLRFGLGRGNDAAQVSAAVEIVARRVEELRAMLAA